MASFRFVRYHCSWLLLARPKRSPYLRFNLLKSMNLLRMSTLPVMPIEPVLPPKRPNILPLFYFSCSSKLIELSNLTFYSSSWVDPTSLFVLVSSWIVSLFSFSMRSLSNCILMITWSWARFSALSSKIYWSSSACFLLTVSRSMLLSSMILDYNSSFFSLKPSTSDYKFAISIIFILEASPSLEDSMSLAC